MFQEQVSNESAKAHMELLCDIEVFLGLACIIPMLECVQSLSKFEMFLFVILLMSSKIVKRIFIGCIVMSKQDMGIMIWSIFEHCGPLQ
jgi:hypothetical protein